MNCHSTYQLRRVASFVMIAMALIVYCQPATAQRNGNGNGRTNGPSGFNKSIPANPGSQSMSRGNRQPSQSFAERNHPRNQHSNYVPNNNYGGRRYNNGGHIHAGSRYDNRYGLPRNGLSLQFSYPYSSGYLGSYSRYPQPYSNYPGYSYDPYYNGYNYNASPFSSQTYLLPYDNFETRLSEYNASRLQQLLEQQSMMRPTIPVDSANLPRGLSIANETSIPTDELSKADQLLAEAAFRERRYEESLNSANRAIARNQSNGYLWLFQSQLHLALGNYEESIQDIGVAIQILKQDEWHYVIDNFREFYRSEDYVTQIERLSQHIKANPRDAVAVGLRGYHFGGLGYPAEAIADLEKAIELSPNQPIYRSLLAQFKEPEASKPVEVLPAPAPKPAGAKPEKTDDPPLKLGGPG